MKFEYKINEQDYLGFQLFTASKSPRITKRKRNGQVLFTLAMILFAVLFYLNGNTPMTIYFVFAAIICGLFYPKYFKWMYKRHYQKYIRENFSKMFGQTEILEIRASYILTKDISGEGRINLTGIEKVDETNNHFFIKIITGISIIIPKRDIKNPNEFRSAIQNLGVIFNDE